jgi:hypothetical protein
VPPLNKEEEERQISERVLNDDSLQPGDIFSRACSHFNRRSDRERSDGDFVALPAR